MERQVNACQTSRSIHPSICNSFPVIRTASAKNRHFHVPQPTFLSNYFDLLFPLETPCDYHAICCIDGKTIECLSNISQHVPIYFQQFPSYSNRKCKKSSFFAYRSPHFCQITLTSCFPLETPLRLSRNMLHRWKDNSMLAKPLAACTYLSSIVSELFEPQV